MRHHVEKRKAVILKKVMFVALQTQLFPEFIDEIHMDLNGAGDRQITEESCVDKAFEGLIGRGRITEVTRQQVPIGALKRQQQVPAFLGGQAAQEARWVPFVEDPEVAQPFLQAIGKVADGTG